jgi:general secretion pathway protein I
LSATGMLKRSEGFTLLEVVVAFVILASAGVIIFQLFSSDLRILVRSEDYIWMSMQAQVKMREVLDREDLKVGTFQETAPEGYATETTISRVFETRTRELPLELLEIVVKLTFPGGRSERSITVRTMKMVKKEQAARI